MQSPLRATIPDVRVAGGVTVSLAGAPVSHPLAAGPKDRVVRPVVQRLLMGGSRVTPGPTFRPERRYGPSDAAYGWMSRKESLMGMALIVGLPVVGLALLLLGVRQFIQVLRARGRSHIEARYPAADVLLLETLAQSFGEESRGPAQLRGSGALALTPTELCFLLYVPKRELRVPIASIESVSFVRSHLGKTQFTDLLHVRHLKDGKSDAIAWRLPDPTVWKAKLDELRR